MDTPLLDDPTRDIDQKSMNALPDHSREPRQHDAEFFAEPPKDIGKLTSAESTLRPGQREKSLAMRLTIACAVGGVFLGGAYWLGSISVPDMVDVLHNIGWALGAAGFIGAWFITRFKVVCTFVGEQGIARATLKGQREGVPRMETLLFPQAEEVRTAQTKQYVNGIYTGTTYNYVWTDAQGKKLWQAQGTYREKKKGLKPGEPFRFAQAAEIAWTMHFLDRADRLLKSDGSVPFRIDKRRIVRVGPGFLEFHFGGEPVRLTSEEIASVSLGEGRFQFKHKDAKWYSLSGKYAFDYGSMANARLFLLCLERFMGYTWS